LIQKSRQDLQTIAKETEGTDTCYDTSTKHANCRGPHFVDKILGQKHTYTKVADALKLNIPAEKFVNQVVS
jgi:hypothetical protein